MFGDGKSSDTFWEIGRNLSKMVRLVHFFYSSPNMAAVEHTHQNEHYCTTIDDLMTTTMFGDGKSSDTFWEIGKNLSKIVRSVHFLKFITNYG